MRVLPRLLILSLLQVFFLSAQTPAVAADLRKFVMGYSTVGAMAAGMWMAKEIGAYEKYGIDAELIYISSGPTVVQALLGGDVVGGVARRATSLRAQHMQPALSSPVGATGDQNFRRFKRQDPGCHAFRFGH